MVNLSFLLLFPMNFECSDVVIEERFDIRPKETETASCRWLHHRHATAFLCDYSGGRGDLGPLACPAG
jgi:hypothetical protein